MLVSSSVTAVFKHGIYWLKCNIYTVILLSVLPKIHTQIQEQCTFVKKYTSFTALFGYAFQTGTNTKLT